MFFARHCPTRRFTRAEWEAMPFNPPGDETYFPDNGYSRSLDSRGKAIVVYCDWERWRGNYVVRPIIVVPAH